MAEDFRQATDELLASLTHHDLAKALGVSVATVRQARLEPGAKARRNPPHGWESVILELAKKQIAHFNALARKLQE